MVILSLDHNWLLYTLDTKVFFMDVSQWEQATDFQLCMELPRAMNPVTVTGAVRTMFCGLC